MAVATQTVVVGVFDDYLQAQRAVAALRHAGFEETKIGVAARQSEETDSESDLRTAESVEAGAITGAVGGAGIGGLWAIGIAAGILPAIGPVIAGGLLASLLASAAGGAAVGGIVGALVGLGISEEDARYYEGELHSGNTLVTVKGNGRSGEVLDILLDHGARIRR
jgi:hypothetical protein